MGTCFSKYITKNLVQIKVNETSTYITTDDMRTIKTMNNILTRVGIFRNTWRRLELEDGTPLFEYSTFRHQTVIITMTNGHKKRFEVIPLYRKQTKSRP